MDHLWEFPSKIPKVPLHLVFRTKVTFYSFTVSRGSDFSVLEQEVLLPCIETFPAVLVITDGLKAGTVFSPWNKEASISTKEVSRCDNETSFLLCFSLELKLCLLLEINSSPRWFSSTP